MNESEKEKFYDEKIAPLQEKIIALCKHSNIALNATFEISEDLTVRTNIPATDRPETARMRLMFYLMKANGNLDAFIIAAKRDGEQHGHSSVVLKILEL
jgi:hypothetical protein